jgi:hypothetical protein
MYNYDDLYLISLYDCNINMLMYVMWTLKQLVGQDGTNTYVSLS